MTSQEEQHEDDVQQLMGFGVTMVSQTDVEQQVDAQLDARAQLATVELSLKKQQKELSILDFQVKQKEETLHRQQKDLSKMFGTLADEQQTKHRTALQEYVRSTDAILQELRVHRDKIMQQIREKKEQIVNLKTKSSLSLSQTKDPLVKQQLQIRTNDPVPDMTRVISADAVSLPNSKSKENIQKQTYKKLQGPKTFAKLRSHRNHNADLHRFIDHDQVYALRKANPKPRSCSVGKQKVMQFRDEQTIIQSKSSSCAEKNPHDQTELPQCTLATTDELKISKETLAHNLKFPDTTHANKRYHQKSKEHQLIQRTPNAVDIPTYTTDPEISLAALCRSAGAPLRAAAARVKERIHEMSAAFRDGECDDDGGGNSSGLDDIMYDDPEHVMLSGHDDDDDDDDYNFEDDLPRLKNKSSTVHKSLQGTICKTRSMTTSHYKMSQNISAGLNGDSFVSRSDHCRNQSSGSHSSSKSKVTHNEMNSDKLVAVNDIEDNDEEDNEDDDASDLILSSSSYAQFRRQIRLHDDGAHDLFIKRLEDWCSQVSQFEDSFTQDDSSLTLGNIATRDTFFNPPMCLAGGIYVPGFLWQKLYPYQQDCMKWLSKLHLEHVGGILGDEMGLGKTIQVIVFLASLIYGTSATTTFEWIARPSPIRKHMQRRTSGAVLIVCPATVLHHWVREIHRWWPPFRVSVVHFSGSHHNPQKLINHILKDGSGDVIVTTYSTFRKMHCVFLPVKWFYAVFDEGHTIRNPDAQVTVIAKQLRTEHRILLTGTPIQNNLRELWSLFDFVFPGRLGTLPTFEAEFISPMMQGSYANANDSQVRTAFHCACVLRDTIAPYILHRSKDDVQAQIDLPPRKEQILFCKLTLDQRSIYEHFLKSREVGNILSGEISALYGIDILRKICNHPDLAITIADPPDYNNLNVPLPWQRSGKMIVLQELLKMWFSNQHRQMLNILESFIKFEGYRYLRLDGTISVQQRQPLIRFFNDNPEIFIFILTTRTGGLGLNLTGADRVIIYDPDWNPSVDVQAKERAWRIGQQKPVTIYRLITAGTIEEKIYHRQVFKQLLSLKVMKDPKQRRFFKTSDLHDLFVLEPLSTSSTVNNAIGIGAETKETETAEIASSFSGEDISQRNTTPLGFPIDSKDEERLNTLSNVARVDTRLVGNASESSPKRHKSSSKSHTCESKLSGVLSSENLKQKLSEDYILSHLFQGTGIHSALEHDRVIESTASKRIANTREARKIAMHALEALRKEEGQARQQSVGTLTWTGKSGRRFTMNSRSQGARLLQAIKSRKQDITEVHASSFGKRLAKNIKQFLEGRGGTSTTKDLLAHFNEQILNDQQEVFIRLLRASCTFKRIHGKGFWTWNNQSD